MLKKEKILLYSLLLFVIIILLYPIILGNQICPKDKFFMGLTGQNGYDEAFYLGWGSKQAEKGYLLFQDKFNGHIERRGVFLPLFIVLGNISRYTPLNVFDVFHFEKILFSVLLLLVAYRFMKYFISDYRWRLLALFFLAFGSGFGSLLIFFDFEFMPYSPDLAQVESYVFISMLWEVVLPAAYFFFLLNMKMAYEVIILENRKAWKLGITTLILVLVYPYAIVSTYFIIGLLSIWKASKTQEWKKYFFICFTMVLISCPVLLYNFYLVFTRPELVYGQALFLSSNLWGYFVGHGVFSILCLLGFYYLYKSNNTKFQFVIIWIIATYIIIYTPIEWVEFQTQLILGIQLPMILVSIFALQKLIKKIKIPIMKYTVIILLILPATITSVYHYGNTIRQIREIRIPDYLPLEIYTAMRWMDENTDDNATVLAPTEIAPYIPVISNNIVFSSNYDAPTADFKEKRKKLDRLLDNTIKKNDSEIIKFLVSEHIQYIFYATEFKEKGKEELKNQILQLSNLKPTVIYSSNDVDIIEIDID